MKMLLMIDAKPNHEDYIHQHYPNISMFSNLIICILEDSNPEVAMKFENLNIV